MLTEGRFSTSDHSPVFTGFHDPGQRWDTWAKPSFDPDQVTQIIDWVMSSPDDGESIRWDGNTLIHHLGVGEAGREEIIFPDPDGRYRIGWRAWPWMDTPATASSQQPATRARQLIGSAFAAEPPAPRSSRSPSPAVTDMPPQDARVREQVHHVGWRTIVVRAGTRGPAHAGFDVFAGGQRLTHADPFPVEPTIAQLGSFLTATVNLAELSYHDRWPGSFSRPGPRRARRNT
jgi:hypothetical protein